MLSQAQAAYVLHSRAYKESSALVDLLTPHGRCRAVLRGARGKAGSLVRPFIPLELELRGRGELKAVARLEPAGVPNLLAGDALLIPAHCRHRVAECSLDAVWLALHFRA